MAGINPRRRILWLPAWSWIILAAILAGLAWIVPPPLTLSEPASVTQLLKPREARLFVTRDNEGFRFVPYPEHRETKPVWNIHFMRMTRQTTDVDYYFVLPGFYHQTAQWNYNLHASRYGNHWDTDAENPGILPPSEVERIRPMAIAELNERFPEEQRGDKLQRLLNNGAERESWFSYQNAIITLAWVAAFIAVAAFISMFYPAPTNAPAPEAM